MKKYTKIKMLVPLVMICALAIFAILPLEAQAALSGNPGGTPGGIANGLGVNDFTTGSTESQGLSNTLLSVAHYALYIFYVLGVIFMGVAAVKFKNGDMEAMGKNLAGSVCLFLVPKLVEVIMFWAAK